MRRYWMLLGLSLLLGSVACGPGPQGAFLDLAFERSGLPDYNVTLASVVVLDADKSQAWLGAERAGLSATAAPGVEAPLDVCRVENSVGSGVSTLRLLDPGLSHLDGPVGSSSLEATPPAFGEGTGYTVRLEADEVPYQPGGAYELRSDGGEAPAFQVNFNAPSEFQVENLGNITPGPGTAVFPATSDLEIVWSPESTSSEEDMYIVFNAAESRIVCRARDDGAFTIKGKLIENLPLGPATLHLERSKLVNLGIVAGGAGKIPGWARIGLRYTYAAELQ